MRRISPVKTALAGVAVAALTVSGAYAASTAADVSEGGDSDPSTTVVNKNGHEVDEHAADGQARAAEARAAAEARKAERPSKPAKPAKPETPAQDDTDEPDEALESSEVDEADEPAEAPAADEVEEEPMQDRGNHGGPNEAAGDHPNENAFLNPQDRRPETPRPDRPSNAGGNGPDAHAGDHPNENATADSRGGRK